MIRYKIAFCLLFLFLLVFAITHVYAKDDTRQKIIKVLRSAGLEDKLDAGVEISITDSNVIYIADKGSYFMQYMIAEPNVSADANVTIDPNLKIPSSANKAVIVTHGFIDKAKNDWPEDIANQIRQKADPNQWICGFFDWRGGASVFTPDDAAKYARDIAGPRLAKALLKLNPNLKHIHLIAHSAGCWTINSAARVIANQTNARIHLTFLDAYVPPSWDQTEFGKIETKNIIWAEHYYTKDITLKYTHTDLSAAHNVDITKIDPHFKEHEFPYRWYHATIAGKYRNKDRESKDEVITDHNGLDYGFARSAETGDENWKKSMTLKKGNEAVKFKKDKKNFNFELFKKNRKAK